MFYPFNKDTTLEHFILKVDNAVSKEICESILKEYKDSDIWEPGTTLDLADSTYRRCDIIYSSHPKLLEKNASNRLYLTDLIFANVAKLGRDYNKLYVPKMETDNAPTAHYSPTYVLAEGWQLLRYTANGGYYEHYDSTAGQIGHKGNKLASRELTCIINLNNEYTGGNIQFFKEIEFELGIGDVLIFPSNMFYPHTVLNIISGTRYSIVVWLS